MPSVTGHTPEDAARVAGIFGYLADRDFRGYSPLYEHLARHLAADDAIPALITGACRRNHAPILFFACVHDLVLRDPTGDLARAYQAVGDGLDPDAVDLWPSLQALVAERGDELDEMLRTREVQTNEVGRSSALVPALTLVGDRFGQPLALIELGASAGLNLLADRYHVTYTAGDGRVLVGPAGSAVQLSCEVHGTRRPPLPDPQDDKAPPPMVIGSRLGVDRNPVDVADPDAVRWLQACVWPGLADRRTRLDAAVALARQDPPELWTGDALDLIEQAVATARPDEVPCVISTWMLAYLSRERRSGPARAPGPARTRSSAGLDHRRVRDQRALAGNGRASGRPRRRSAPHPPGPRAVGPRAQPGPVAGLDARPRAVAGVARRPHGVLSGAGHPPATALEFVASARSERDPAQTSGRRGRYPA